MAIGGGPECRIGHPFLLCQAAAGWEAVAALLSVKRWLNTVRAKRRFRQRSASVLDMPSAFFLVVNLAQAAIHADLGDRDPVQRGVELPVP
jgi:hypothetical protein